MLNGEPFFSKDKWLSDCLGVHCYGLSAQGATFEELSQTQSLFITAKIQSEENRLYRVLLKKGFLEINKQVTFRKCLKQVDSSANNQSQLPPGCKIVLQSSFSQFDKFSSLFEFDRFSMDQNLPSNWSSMIKGEWMGGNDSNKRFIVVYAGEEAVGFILFKGGNDYVIELVCVLKEYRGKGLARCMLSFLQEEALKNLVTGIVVGTQKENPNSTYVYRSFGFVLVGEQSVLHFSRGIELHD